MYKDPFNYVGNKAKLLPQIMSVFPKEINLFVDLFAGGACVSMNTIANKYLVNDKNFQLIQMLKCLKIYSEEDIISEIESIIEIFGLSKENKEEFITLRECYNENPLTKDDDVTDRKVYIRALTLYMLITHSFNYLIHFNSNGGFSVPSGAGRSYFNNNLREKLVTYIKEFKRMKVQFSSSDFRKVIDVLLNNNKIGEGDFIFVDPPYAISDDSYSRIKYLKWTEKEEEDLYKYLNKLNEKNVKFALTNILKKGEDTNHLLKDFIKNYKVIELKSNYINCNYQKSRVDSQEILVINY